MLEELNRVMGAGHDHHHHHHYDGLTLGRIKTAFFLNLFFACVELIGGYYVNSVAVMSDAVHDFGDSMSLGIAYFMEKKSQSKADSQFSYGYRRLSTLSALITGVVLLVGSAVMIVMSISRLTSPELPKLNEMIWIAVLGVVVNGYSAYQISRGSSLNEKVLTWHMMEDLFGWIAVLAGAIAMKLTSVPQIDSVLGLVLSLWIIKNVVINLKSALWVFLQKTPEGVELHEVSNFISSLAMVGSAHHVHLWSIDGDHHILTAHVLLKAEFSLQQIAELKHEIKRGLKLKFHIVEATIEFESPLEACFDPTHG